MFLLNDCGYNSVINPNDKDSKLLHEFNYIYPFTNENIAGYMHDLDLTNKKIVSVAGSSDHVINAISRGASDITAFDVNPLAKYYFDLRIAAIKTLSYYNYIRAFIYGENTIDYDTIDSLDMPEDSKDFWLGKRYIIRNNWSGLRNSSLFGCQNVDPNSLLYCNLYFDEYVYEDIKSRINSVNINYIQTNLKDLTLDKQYDYMFLSTISDYAECMYDNNPTENYCYLIQKFSENVENIYFAYLYDIPFGYEKVLEIYKSILGNYETKTFDTSLSTAPVADMNDAVLILTRNKNIR